MSDWAWVQMGWLCRIQYNDIMHMSMLPTSVFSYILNFAHWPYTAKTRNRFWPSLVLSLSLFPLGFCVFSQLALLWLCQCTVIIQCYKGWQGKELEEGRRTDVGRERGKGEDWSKVGKEKEKNQTTWREPLQTWGDHSPLHHHAAPTMQYGFDSVKCCEPVHM